MTQLFQKDRVNSKRLHHTQLITMQVSPSNHLQQQEKTMAARRIKDVKAAGAALVARVSEYEAILFEDVEQQEEIEWPLTNDASLVWSVYKGTPSWCRSLTGFNPQFLHDLALDCIDATPVHRGKASKLTPHDCLFVLLNYYKTGATYQLLSAYFKQKANLLRDGAERIRPILNKVLKQRHADMVQASRPVFQQLPHSVAHLHVGNGKNEIVRDIGLACDCTPLPIPKPQVGFEAGKAYFDAHHNIYANKIEVAVSTSAPFKAIAWSDLHLGGVPDISVHRGPDGAQRYTVYLRMTDEEQVKIFGGVTGEKWWAAVLDAGYGGAVTCSYPRIVLKPPKTEMTSDELAAQLYYKNRRVIVEQFFGRMKKIWLVTAKPYLLDKGTHEMDINNIIMLTNAHIEQMALCEKDGSFYRKWRSYVKLKEQKKREDKNAATKRWRKKVTLLTSASSGIQGTEEFPLEVEEVEEAEDEEEEEEELYPPLPRRMKPSTTAPAAAPASEKLSDFELSGDDEVFQTPLQRAQAQTLLEERQREETNRQQTSSKMRWLTEQAAHDREIAQQHVARQAEEEQKRAAARQNQHEERDFNISEPPIEVPRIRLVLRLPATKPINSQAPQPFAPPAPPAQQPQIESGDGDADIAEGVAEMSSLLREIEAMSSAPSSPEASPLSPTLPPAPASSSSSSAETFSSSSQPRTTLSSQVRQAIAEGTAAATSGQITQKRSYKHTIQYSP